MNISPSSPNSYPPNSTPEDKARIDRAVRIASEIDIPYGLGLAMYLERLEKRIASLEKELNEKGH